MTSGEAQEEVSASVRRVLYELTPYMWWFIKLRNLIEAKSILMSITAYSLIFISWWMEWLCIMLVLLFISTIFISSINKHSISSSSLFQSELEVLIIRKLLREKENTIQLKTETEILSWILNKAATTLEFLHLKYRGWSTYTISTMVSIVLMGLVTAYFGIVTTIHIVTQMFFVFCFCISICVTFITPVRSWVYKSSYLVDLRRQILEGITTQSARELQSASIENISGRFQVYSGRLQLEDSDNQSTIRNSVLFSDHYLLFCADQKENIPSQEFKLRKQNAVFPSNNDLRSFSLLLKSGDSINCSCESKEEASEWIAAVNQLTFEKEEFFENFVPFASEDYLDKSKRYNFFLSPFPNHYTPVTFSESFPITNPKDLLELAPIISDEILTKQNSSSEPNKFLYVLFQTFLFQFHKVSGQNQFLDLQASRMLVCGEEYAIEITCSSLSWTLMFPSEDKYEQWLAAFAFSYLSCPDDRDSPHSSNDVFLCELKNPLHSGMLREPKQGEYETWHAVFCENTLHLFISNSPREVRARKICLINTSIVMSGTRSYNDRVYYLFTITNFSTNEEFLFATLSSRSRDLWVRVLSIVGDAEKRNGSLPEVADDIRISSLKVFSSPDLTPTVDDNDDEDIEDETIETDNKEEPSDGPADSEQLRNEENSAEEFPSMIRIPKEDIEGIGLDVASYELLHPQHKGFLLKRGDIVKRWQRRYFVLKNDVVYYFRDITDRICAGTIELKQCHCPRSISLPKFPYAFVIPNSLTGRDYLLSASSEEDRDEWIKAISESAPSSRENFSSLLPCDDYQSSDDKRSSVNFSLCTITHEGYVQKRKKLKFLSNWNRRYFKLKDGILKSFISHSDKTPKTVWTVTDITVTDAIQQGPKFCFTLEVQGVEKASYTIALGTQAEVDEWIDVITRARHQMVIKQETWSREWKQPSMDKKSRRTLLGSGRSSPNLFH